MYVCLCRGITDRQIRAAIQEGCCSYRDVRLALGVATQCGKCACDAKGLVRETLNATGQLSAQARSLAYPATVSAA